MTFIVPFAVCTIILSMMCCPPAIGQERQTEGWVLITSRNLPADIGRDALDLRDYPVAYKAVRFAVRSGALKLTRVSLTYRNGLIHDEDRTIDLQPGKQTEQIGGANPPQPIERVSLVYAPQSGNQQNIPLEVWGLIAVQGSTEILLGTETAGFRVDRATISVGPEQPVLNQLKLRATNDDVFVNDVRVFYSNKPHLTIPINKLIRENTTSGWISLANADKIARIELGYRALPNFSGPASIEIYGNAANSKPAGRCTTKGLCTPVQVFFGTNRRKQDGPDRIQFSADRTDNLVLGRATVTVPRAFRRKGDIPRPSWWDLLKFRNPWQEDPVRHFTIPPGGIIVYDKGEDFIAAIKKYAPEIGEYKDHAVIFIHGYNVSFDNALFRIAQISYDLGSEDIPFGVPVLYSWPSAGEVEDYVYDLDSSRLAMAAFKSFLELIANKSGARHIHIVAHSMGNFPTLHVLNGLSGDRVWQGKIKQMIFAAPDVDAEEFGKLAKSAVVLGKGITLYASKNDRAMIAARKLRRDTPRAGDIPQSGPVIVGGVDTVDVSAVSTDIFSLNHSTYADKREILNDMWRLMRTGERPPDHRSLSIRPKREGDKLYWQFVE